MFANTSESFTMCTCVWRYPIEIHACNSVWRVHSWSLCVTSYWAPFLQLNQALGQLTCTASNANMSADTHIKHTSSTSPICQRVAECVLWVTTVQADRSRGCPPWREGNEKTDTPEQTEPFTSCWRLVCDCIEPACENTPHRCHDTRPWTRLKHPHDHAKSGSVVRVSASLGNRKNFHHVKKMWTLQRRFRRQPDDLCGKLQVSSSQTGRSYGNRHYITAHSDLAD